MVYLLKMVIVRCLDGKIIEASGDFLAKVVMTGLSIIT